MATTYKWHHRDRTNVSQPHSFISSWIQLRDLFIIFHFLLTALFSFWKVFGSPPFSGCAVITFHLRCGMLCMYTSIHTHTHQKNEQEIMDCKTDQTLSLEQAHGTFFESQSKIAQLIVGAIPSVQINPKLEQLRNICEPLVRKQRMKLQGARKSPETGAFTCPMRSPANGAPKSFFFSPSLSLSLSPPHARAKIFSVSARIQMSYVSVMICFQFKLALALQKYGHLPNLLLIMLSGRLRVKQALSFRHSDVIHLKCWNWMRTKWATWPLPAMRMRSLLNCKKHINSTCSQSNYGIVHLLATKLLARKLRCARLWKAASYTSEADLHCLLRKLSEEWQVIQVPVLTLFPRSQYDYESIAFSHFMFVSFRFL